MSGSSEKMAALLARLSIPVKKKLLEKAACRHTKYYHRLVEALEPLSLRLTGQTPLNQLFIVTPSGSINNLWEQPNIVLVEQAYRWKEAIVQALERLHTMDANEARRVETMSHAEQLYWFLYWEYSPVKRLEQLDSLTHNLNRCLVVNYATRQATLCVESDETLQLVICMKTRLRSSNIASVIKLRRDAINKALRCANRLRRKLLPPVKIEEDKSKKRALFEEEAIDEPHKRMRFIEDEPLVTTLEPLDWEKFMERRAWLHQMTESMS